MSIPQTPIGAANPAAVPAAVFATLRRAARDSQVARGAGLAVLNTLATETNAWRRFTVTGLTAPDALNVSRKTISRALRLLSERGYLEERPIMGKHQPGEREARLIVTAPGSTR